MSTFRFNPTAGLLPDGVYRARVTNVAFGQSKKGNNMATLKLAVEGPDGEEHTITDYLVDVAEAIWKTIAFCESAGIDPMKGGFTETEALGAEVGVSIGKQEGQERNDGQGKFTDKNIILNYVLDAPPKAAKSAPKQDPAAQGIAKAAEEAQEEDPLPF